MAERKSDLRARSAATSPDICPREATWMIFILNTRKYIKSRKTQLINTNQCRMLRIVIINIVCSAFQQEALINVQENIALAGKMKTKRKRWLLICMFTYTEKQIEVLGQQFDIRKIFSNCNFFKFNVINKSLYCLYILIANVYLEYFDNSFCSLPYIVYIKKKIICFVSPILKYKIK
ncbi:hypothetical protein ALC53_12126 [Atta colombica]|uniref:Uncharacterized protein n=1 Tax=Atta colombica TaxID=520822 RepID=A0A195AZM9_9HYME|nr:hypothetical protein ALC53_12126 [Atta colombica]